MTKKITVIIIATILVCSLLLCSCTGGATPWSEEKESVQITITKSTDSENGQALLQNFIDEAQTRTDAGKSYYTLLPSYAVSHTTSFPETFDLRAADTNGDGKTENYVTSVKRQHPFGSCWSFATISAAETGILYDTGQDAVATDENGKECDSIDLSEHQAAFFMYTPIREGSQAGEGWVSTHEDISENPNMIFSSGSTQYAAATIFAYGEGIMSEPDFDSATENEAELNYHGKEYLTEEQADGTLIYSKDDDWTVSEDNRIIQSYILTDTYMLPSTVSVDENGEYDIQHAKNISNVYKEQIMNGRPVSLAFHSDNYSPDKEERAPQYINYDKTWAHYCYEKTDANHAVTIIGWDDNYSKENFLTEVQDTDENGTLLYNNDGSPKMKSVSQPPENGAWIVKNSWGSTDSIGQGLNIRDWGVDGSGYFYLSYYDMSIETAECFEFDSDHSLQNEYGNYTIKCLDYTPNEIPHGLRTDGEISVANVFTAEKNETIKSVSISTYENDENVTIDIYAMDESENGTTNITLLASQSSDIVFPGLHLVSISEECTICAGQEYAVVVSCKTSDNSSIISINSEFNENGNKAGLCADKYYATSVVNNEESYIVFEDNTWLDFSAVKEKLESLDGPSEFVTYDNFPIKIYATIN